MSATPETLDSYLSGRWQRGQGIESTLIDPVTGDELATVSAKGLDLNSALEFARREGQRSLRNMNYAERGKLVGAVADVLTANRARYEAIAIANSGNTKMDAAIDIDGGIGTLKYYARLGAGLGEARTLLDEKPVRLAKAENYQAIHLMVPRRGVAVHINAFNFPGWALWEKAAVSLLAGVPVLAKPASATALLAHAMIKDVIAAGALPAGALSLLCGSAGGLLEALTSEDLVAFTGSADTAARVRGHPNAVAKNVPVNIEADSINAALLAPDASPAGAAFDAFVRETVREMTVKAGQKCTAIRRIFVPAEMADAVADALSGKLKTTKVGDPRQADTRMGPLVTRAQQAAAFEGIRHLACEAAIVCGGADAPELDGNRGEQDAAALIARGGGSLVASVYGEDKDFLARMVSEIAPSHGRILAVDPAIATAHTGHGIVMPQCNHGGPGRAGAGEELGGLFGLRFYHQRLAVQGSSELLASLQATAASMH
ncbi:MAG: 3,4-dehydroadipyl-CoA semialdehyde dehydrogenase [Alphaproteobacteria bacterium]|nr:MAG: 3,4-dehydroadipyl-CoA semialdehyde dehydrogenase [Alphaproteobacteria bacterium]